MPDQRFRTAGEQIAQLTELLRATEVAVMSSAPTMLPMQAFTPPHITPPHVPMYASQPPPPPYAGASTNEPMIHASQQNMRPQQGLGTGAKVAIVLSLLAAFGAMVVAGLFIMYRSMNDDPAPASTYVAPTITATTVAAPTTVQAPIESLTPTATATVTATATTKIQPTATATAHVNTGATREQCRASCKLACVDATDGMDCLTKCLMRCPR
jgi:hypothetical protein